MNSDPEMEATSHSVVNFSEERPRKLVQEPVDDVCNIDKLGDELLLEVLIRLPNYESAIRCKCISKQWLNLILISSNFFTAQSKRNRSKNSLPFALVSTYFTEAQNSERTHVYSKDNEARFACFGLNPNFLSQLCNEREKLRLEAVHMDLLLFGIERIWRGRDAFDLPIHRKYVICNPRTKQWISLPHLPYGRYVHCTTAIVCEPHCSSENNNGKHCIQDSCRYRVFAGSGVVRTQLDVYKSETHQWEKLFLPCRICSVTGPTMYNGKLHFLNGSNFVAFDPFSAEDEGGGVSCCVIDVPSVSNGIYCFTHLGTSSGSLLFCMADWVQSILKAWELKDYDKGEWCLKHAISTADLLAADAYTVDCVWNKRLLGFHPYDIDIIYVYSDHSILECNMQMRTSRVVYEYQDIGAITSERDKGMILGGIGWVFLPWWPTPVPALA